MIKLKHGLDEEWRFGDGKDCCLLLMCCVEMCLVVMSCSMYDMLCHLQGNPTVIKDDQVQKWRTALDEEELFAPSEGVSSIKSVSDLDPFQDMCWTKFHGPGNEQCWCRAEIVAR